MILSEFAIETARGYIGRVESGANDAAWLRALMDTAGNPARWVPGQAYCIAGALACYAVAYKAAGITFPDELRSASTQTFYQKALNIGATLPTPRPGAIGVMRLGTSWHGHAFLCLAADATGIDTLEFNTSPTAHGDQRNGEGVYAKRRNFADFKLSNTKLWLRGYVGMPYADELMPLTGKSVEPIV